MTTANKPLGILLYGDENHPRDAFTEEKYALLADAFLNAGFQVNTITYNDQIADQLVQYLKDYHVILVWVNPIENGHDRKKLDEMLKQLASSGVLISTLPGVILKMGTKEVLYTTKEIGWAGDVRKYNSVKEFENAFPLSLQNEHIRVLKQHRGNGGHGIFKVSWSPDAQHYAVLHAGKGSNEVRMSTSELVTYFKPFFDNDGILIDQPWHHQMTNGMVRCYSVGNRVAGFGYQEINALYEYEEKGKMIPVPTGKRYYFTERCGLFADLKLIMEKQWIPQLREILAIPLSQLPVIWDADFFINSPQDESAAIKYTLCEINVSCVSPFPPSAVQFIVDEVRKRLH